MNEEKKIKTISDFCADKGISFQEFSNITGLSYSWVNRIKDGADISVVGLDTIIKVWKTTRDKYGAGNALVCQEWLDIPPFWEK